MFKGSCVYKVKYLEKDVDMGLYRIKHQQRVLIRKEEKLQDSQKARDFLDVKYLRRSKGVL